MRILETLFLIIYIPFVIIGVWIHELRGLWDKEPGMHIEPKWRDKDEFSR